MQPTKAENTQPPDRLRDDIRVLGDLVGGVLREQASDSIFAQVEAIRT
nr:hypothetical protein [Ktedonobacterales bacterium]